MQRLWLYISFYLFVQCYIFMFRTMYTGLYVYMVFVCVFSVVVVAAATVVEIIIITHNTNNFLIYDPYLCHCFVHTILNIIPLRINNSHSNNMSVCSFYGWLASRWQVYKRTARIPKTHNKQQKEIKTKKKTKHTREQLHCKQFIKHKNGMDELVTPISHIKCLLYANFHECPEGEFKKKQQRQHNDI